LDALAPEAPLLYPSWGENVLGRRTFASGRPDQTFAEAAVVVRAQLTFGRQTGLPMECRGALARFDPAADRIVLASSSQSPHHATQQLAAGLGREERFVSVVTPDVGGSFGVKDHACAEEGVLCVLAAGLKRPLKWVQDRHEDLLAGVHSREQRYELELAADGDARILAVRGRLVFDAGARSGNHGLGTALYSATVLPGPYAFDHYQLEVVGVVTNKAPSAAYRGYGAPEATFAMEGLVEALARETGFDPIEVRLRNLITPDAHPYRSPTGCAYDRADHPRALRLALDAAGYKSVSSERVAPGRRRGVGVACFVMMGGFGPSRAAVAAGMSFGGYETALIRLDGDGRATVFIGMPTQGQGIETALAQTCAVVLGLDPSHDVQVVSGDTRLTPFSPVGAIASRGATVGGAAVRRAAERLAERIRHVAAELLGAEPEDVRLERGQAAVADRDLPLATVAAAAQRGIVSFNDGLPPLEATATVEPEDDTFSYGAHVAVVDVDVALGTVEVIRYAATSDCGTLINPAIVRGQIEGGIVQGIGGALMEELAYDADGRPLAETLFDYVIPTCADTPSIVLRMLETPAALSPTGARGAGEIGIVGPAAAIAGAVGNALGVCPTRVPLTPEHVHSLVVESAAR
jgi:carbon-monoxide dehydrogenase large subunit